MQSLNSTQFKCEDCDESFPYEHRKSHWQKCGVTYKCQIPSCSMSDTDFESVVNLEKHWNEQCSAIKLQCSVCQASLKRGQIEEHSCEPALVALVKQLRETVKRLELENEKLKEEKKDALFVANLINKA